MKRVVSEIIQCIQFEFASSQQTAVTGISFYNINKPWHLHYMNSRSLILEEL